MTLFALISLGVLLLSGIAGYFEWAVEDPRPEGTKARSADGMIRAVSLLTPEGLRRIGMGLVTNFTSFALLGTVLVALLGVGVAERSGLLGAAIRGLVFERPESTDRSRRLRLLSRIRPRNGICGPDSPGSRGLSFGRAVSSCGSRSCLCRVSGGYSANILIGTVDPLLSGITTEAAQIIDGSYAPGGPNEVLATANYYFMFISTFLITIVGTLVTTRIVEPKLGPYDPSNAEAGVEDAAKDMGALTGDEKRGLKLAGLTLLLMLGGLAAMALPENGWFRDPAENETLIQDLKPLLKSVVALIFIFFIVLDCVRKSHRVHADRPGCDRRNVQSYEFHGLYLVLVFAAQFVAFFKWTELGTITAIVGADLLQVPGPDWTGVLIPFI